jgi:hypothetical protein
MRLFEIETSLRQEIENFPFVKKSFVYRSSTLDFEKKTGIKVSQDYKMPDNLTVEEVYKYSSSVLRALDTRKIKTQEYRNRMKFIYDSIENLNPVLKTIQSPIENVEGHVLTAVLSRFNIDDIRSYVVDGKTGRWYINQPDYLETRYKKLEEIEQRTGAKITWIMSPKTLDRVYAEVLKKY